MTETDGGQGGMTREEAESLNVQVKESTKTLRDALYTLRTHEGYKLLGYSTWGAYVEAELDQSARTIRNYLQQADAEQRLIQVWKHVDASGNALTALQRLIDDDGDDSLMLTVYEIASEQGTATVTVDRVKSTLAALNVVLRTGAVEDGSGNMLPVLDPLMDNVRMVDAESGRARDNCRWVVSRVKPDPDNFVIWNDTLDIRLHPNRSILENFRGIDSGRIVISIGIEDTP